MKEHTTTAQNFGTCAHCKRTFETSEAFNAHLPCNGSASVEPTRAITQRDRQLLSAARLVEAHSHCLKIGDRDDHYIVDVEAMDKLCKAISKFKTRSPK
jgi:hypothetical protein